MDKKGHLPSLGAELSALGRAPVVTVDDEAATAIVVAAVEVLPPITDNTALAIVETTSALVEAVTPTAIAPSSPGRTAPALLARRATLPPIPPDALSAALLLARRPALVKTARSQPLPPDVIMLIRIASGSAETLRRAVHLTGKDPTFIRAAAEFYLEEVLGAEGSDAYRTLGLAPGASYDEIAEHTRWLTRWLLPHLGKSDPQAAHLERVLVAWARLKDPEARLNALKAVTHGEIGGSTITTAGWPRWQIAAIAAVGIVAFGVVAMSGRISNPISAFATNAQEPASTAATETRPGPNAN